MKRITLLSLALIMFSLFSISYLVTSVSAQNQGNANQQNQGNANQQNECNDMQKTQRLC